MSIDLENPSEAPAASAVPFLVHTLDRVIRQFNGDEHAKAEALALLRAAKSRAQELEDIRIAAAFDPRQLDNVTSLSPAALAHINEQRGTLYQALAIIKCSRLAIDAGCDMDDMHRVLYVVEDLIETANTGLDTVEIERAAKSDQPEVAHG